MNKNNLKKWATPLTIGTFFLMAITGVLMFYHIKLGAIKVAHEWIGLLMIGAALFHVYGNWKPFLNYFKNRSAVSLMSIFIVGTFAVMLIPTGGRGPRGPGSQGAPISRFERFPLEDGKYKKTLLTTPIQALSIVSGKSLDDIERLLKKEGLNEFSTQKSLVTLVGKKDQASKLLDQIIN